MFAALVDWGNWASWGSALPILAALTLESGGPGVVGSTRLTNHGNAPCARERLTACDIANLTVAYELEADAPFPTYYSATVRLLPLSDGSGTVIDWIADFSCADPAAEPKQKAFFERYYHQFIDALAAV